MATFFVGVLCGLVLAAGGAYALVRALDRGLMNIERDQLF